MSMNLYVNGMDLRQTPSYITDMCLSYGKNKAPDGGMEGVRRRYIFWILYNMQLELNENSRNPEAQKWIRESAKEHIRDVEAIKNPIFGME